MTETIARVFSLLSVRWQKNIDEKTHSAARFVTHVRYVFACSAEVPYLAPQTSRLYAEMFEGQAC